MNPETRAALARAVGAPSPPTRIEMLALTPLALLGKLVEDSPGRPESEEERRLRVATANDAKFATKTERKL